MIETLLKTATRRQIGPGALGFLTAMLLWLYLPEAPSWFYLGGAVVTTWFVSGGIFELWYRWEDLLTESEAVE